MNYYKVALSKYAVFSGRSRRAEYWYFALFNLIISFVLSRLDRVLGLGSGETAGLLSGLFVLALIIPGLAVAVRRLHDIGRSGWWIFLAIIPIIGGIILIIFMALDSQPGDNQYGPNPKGVGGSSTNSSTNNATPAVSAPAGFPTSATTQPPTPPVTQ
jgi:uncharacterized membrane protein YhaH (DUF805 family)